MTNENYNFQVTIFCYKNTACHMQKKHCFSQVVYLHSISECDISLLDTALRFLFGASIILDIHIYPVLT